MSTQLAPFTATLAQVPEVDALQFQLSSQGCDGGHARLTDFIRPWRDKQGKFISGHAFVPSCLRAFVPLAFEPGEAFQFDWNEEGLVAGGICWRRQVSQLKLCASGPCGTRLHPTLNANFADIFSLEKESEMPDTKGPGSAAFRQQMHELFAQAAA